ncbi:MAG: hypothetical protein GX836_00230 [Spirochaetales bacterium]|nr:hypothetical protein [Spirochaetales bacterium]
MDTILLLYIALALLHLSLRAEGLKRPGSLTKVLLMPTLMAYVLANGAQPLLLVSLSLATLGDYFLTDGTRKAYFTLGMVSFALAHLLYSIHLLLRPLHQPLLVIGTLIALIPLIYLVLLLKASAVKLRYLLYGINLFVMTALCFGSGSHLASLGALAFIISDGMIAMGTLHRRRFSGVTEMAAYILAQLLLVQGLVNL